MHISIFTHQLLCYFVNYCVISNFMFFFSKKRWRKLSWGEHLFQICLFDFSVPESLNKTRKIKNWKKKYWIPENVCIANRWNNLTTWQFTLLRLYNNKTNGHNNKHNYFIWCRYLILDKCGLYRRLFRALISMFCHDCQPDCQSKYIQNRLKVLWKIVLTLHALYICIKSIALNSSHLPLPMKSELFPIKPLRDRKGPRANVSEVIRKMDKTTVFFFAIIYWRWFASQPKY